MSEVRRVHAVDGLFAETSEGPRLLRLEVRRLPDLLLPALRDLPQPRLQRLGHAAGELRPHGTLWSYAIQNYPPPPPVLSPQPYEPYGVGLVDMPGGLRVLGRLSTPEPMAVEVGCRVELVLEALTRNEAGEDVISWQFKPL